VRIRKHANAENLPFCVAVIFLGTIMFVGILNVWGACESSLKVEGNLALEYCGPQEPQETCVPASKALFDYCATAAKATDPSVLLICSHANPWRLYGGDMRIVTIEDMVNAIKHKLINSPAWKDIDPPKRIVLVGSWTAVAPGPKGKSLVQKLSAALGDIPVSGMDGFVWLAKDGTVRTTHQAFTIVKPAKYPYLIRPGSEVMASFVAGWPVAFEEDYLKKKDAQGIMRAAAGWDIFMLCPEKALKLFEAAAELSHPIAAYNAAMIYLERGEKADLEAATALFKLAASLGDKWAKEKLEKLK
jgi:hypothetical protein